MVKIWEEPGIVDPTSWRHAETDDDGITHESRSFVQRTAENLGIPQAKDTVMEGARLAFLGVVWLGSKAIDVTVGNVVRGGLLVGGAIIHALDPVKRQRKEIFKDQNPPKIVYGSGGISMETIHPIDRMRARIKKLRKIFANTRYYEVTSERQADGTRLKRTK